MKLYEKYLQTEKKMSKPGIKKSFTKIAKTIISAKTHEHLDMATKMLNQYARMYKKFDDWERYEEEAQQLNILIKKKMLEIIRKG